MEETIFREVSTYESKRLETLRKIHESGSKEEKQGLAKKLILEVKKYKALLENEEGPFRELLKVGGKGVCRMKDLMELSDKDLLEAYETYYQVVEGEL